MKFYLSFFICTFFVHTLIKAQAINSFGFSNSCAITQTSIGPAISKQQWYLLDSSAGVAGISLTEAYKLLLKKQSVPVIVAVIDSGIDTIHKDLKEKLWINKYEIPNNGIDDDKNGFVDDIHGWNFIVRRKREDSLVKKDSVSANARNNLPENNNDLRTGINHHGTHIAGIIGAVRNNGLGIDGIVENVQLMILRASAGKQADQDMKEFDLGIAKSIVYAVDHGAKVINISLLHSGFCHKKEVDSAVQYAEKKGVLIVRAAGNDENDVDIDMGYPSPFFLNGEKASNFIIVGASSRGLHSGKAPYSNRGIKNIDVFAPGVDILSTIPDNQYQEYDGTSMAAPIVSGIAALLFSYFPHYDYKTVRQIIESSVRKLEPGNNLERFCKTGGIVNAYEAVKKALGQ